MLSPKVLLLVVGVLAIALISSACNSPEASGEAFERVAAIGDFDARERPYGSVEELAARITSLHEDGNGNSRLVVVGSFSSVERGRSFRWEGARAEELPYGDSNSMSNTVHLTFDVSETLAPHAEKGPSQLTVGLAIGTGLDFDKVKADYMALDQVVLFLLESNAFAYQPDIYSIYEDGLIMGVIDDQDNVTFPLIKSDSSLVGPAGIALHEIRDSASAAN